MDPNLQQQIRRAGLVLYGKIKNYKFTEVNGIINTPDYPIDWPMTDTQMSAFQYACCLPDNNDDLR